MAKEIKEAKEAVDDAEDSYDNYKTNVAIQKQELVSMQEKLKNGEGYIEQVDVDAIDTELAKYEEHSIGSKLSANNVNINAGNTATIQGGSVDAQEAINVDANELNILASKDTNNQDSNIFIPYDIILIMKKEAILNYLSTVKSQYQNEGFLIKALFGSYSRDEADDNSDVDILVEATPEFANRYGFGAIERIKEIQSEISSALGLPIDLADSTGMGKTGKKFIIDRAIYV